MNTKKLERLSVRWGLLGSIIVLVVFGIQQLISDPFDEAVSMMITEKWVIKMPFNVSVWWYLFFGSIMAISIILTWHRVNGETEHKKDLRQLTMCMGLILGFLFAGMTGNIFGILITLEVNIFAVVLWILVAYFVFYKKYLDSIVATITFGFFLGIGNILDLGIIPGLFLASITTVVGTIIAVLFLNIVFAIRGLKSLPAQFPVLIDWVRGIDIEEEGEIEKENEEE